MKLYHRLAAWACYRIADAYYHAGYYHIARYWTSQAIWHNSQ